jgi:hypothetical protein
LGAAPLDVYMAQIEQIKHIADPAAPDLIFWRRLTRKALRRRRQAPFRASFFRFLCVTSECASKRLRQLPAERGAYF